VDIVKGGLIDRRLSGVDTYSLVADLTKARRPSQRFLAGYTFGGLSTPGNGSSGIVLPIVQCHSTLACAGGGTSFQCFQGYADTRCAHKASTLLFGSRGTDLRRPPKTPFKTPCSEDSLQVWRMRCRLLRVVGTMSRVWEQNTRALPFPCSPSTYNTGDQCHPLLGW
jgi:hypothetical protein